MWSHDPYSGGPAPAPPPDRGGAALRTVLILAAVTGVAAVAAGLLIVLQSPGEYGLRSTRDTLNLQAQPNQNGQPEQALFQAPADVPPPLPQITPASPMLPSTPTRIVIKKLGIDAPIKSVGLAKDGTIEVPRPTTSTWSAGTGTCPPPARRGRPYCSGTRTRVPATVCSPG
ncbi:hypothetical protein ACFQ0B_76925 [Nonomuraea thailandensis]